MKKTTQVLLLSLSITSFFYGQKFYGNPTVELSELVQTVTSAALDNGIYKLENDSLPNWLLVKYPDSTKINYSWGVLKTTIDKFQQLNNQISFCIYSTEDGLCSESYLATFTDSIELENVRIAEVCDNPYSDSGYEWSAYKLVKNDTIISILHVEEIPDSSKDNANKDENVELIYYTITTKLIVAENGQIKKIVAEKVTGK